MSAPQLIPVTPGNLNGQMRHLVDARPLHGFLEVRRDFSNWIKGRIQEFGFIEGEDYLLAKSGEQVPHQGGLRAVAKIDYFLTLDVAKELAMVERTPRGRQARRYFIACEQQLQRLQQVRTAAVKAHPVALSRAERQAINRQAWADVAGQAHALFHARRESLLCDYMLEQDEGIDFLPQGFIPYWAK